MQDLKSGPATVSYDTAWQLRCHVPSLTGLSLLPVWLHPLPRGEFFREFQDLSGGQWRLSGETQRQNPTILLSRAVKWSSGDNRKYIQWVAAAAAAVAFPQYTCSDWVPRVQRYGTFSPSPEPLMVYLVRRRRRRSWAWLSLEFSHITQTQTHCDEGRSRV